MPRVQSSVSRSRLFADQSVSTPAENAALRALRQAAGGTDTPMERHCLRVFLIIERLAADRPIPIDREVALCASLLFDIGVYPLVSTRDVYTNDGRRFAKQGCIQPVVATSWTLSLERGRGGCGDENGGGT